MHRAKCLGDDPESYFAPVDLDFETGKRLADERGIAFCRSRCGVCPVRWDCFQYQMSFEGTDPEQYRFGVFGGTTGPQRASLFKRGDSAWKCSDCNRVYDPILLISGIQACICGHTSVGTPVSDLGDSWSERHTKLAQQIRDWVQVIPEGAPVQSPTSWAKQHGIRKDDACRVWRALVEDGMLVQIARGRYIRNRD
jgi:hypothetical protein